MVSRACVRLTGMNAKLTFKQGLKHSKAVNFLTQPAALPLQAQLLHALLM